MWVKLSGKGSLCDPTYIVSVFSHLMMSHTDLAQTESVLTLTTDKKNPDTEVVAVAGHEL